MKRMILTVSMANGDEFDVTSTTKDFVAYDDTAKRQRPQWGSMGENTPRWEAFVAWHAARRMGKYDKPWESFLDDCVNVDGRPLDMDPTVLAPGAEHSVS